MERRKIMSKKYVISADIGGTNIRAALVDAHGTIKARVKEATGDEPLAVLQRLIGSLYSGHEGDVGGVGLAVAGIIDRDNGIVMRSPNISKLAGQQLVSAVSSLYKTTVVIENDANAAAYGEKCAGAGKDFKNFVVLTLGTGIGGGVVINNQLLPIAAEVGHMSVDANGQACACGNIGCLESYASATAIIGNAVSLLEKGGNSILKDSYSGNIYKVTAEDIYNAALEDDALSRTVLKEAGKSLGIGIANIINIFSPEAIVLAGGLTGAWNIYVDSAIKEASKRTLKELYERVVIIPSSLGDDAGIIGAANLVFDACKTN